MATYKHGVYTSEQATSMTAPVTGTAGLQVVVGTAPVNMLEHPEQAVNTPLLAYNYKEAVAAVGYHDDFAAYTLCESISAAFSVVGTGPLVLINVLDPAKHTADIAETTVQVNSGVAVLDVVGVLLDKLTVDYYGAPTPIQQVASVAVSEARTLTITPWDRTLLRAISKAIMASDVGINPIDDGQTIRLNFPAPTEERRKQLAKEVSKLGEEAKVAVRNIRRDAMDKAKVMKKAGELTEDSQKTMEEDVQKLTDKYIKNIDAAVEEKQKEIMSV